MDSKQIAITVAQQMGGFGRLSAMVNGRDWLTLEHGIQFTFSGKRGVNKCLVMLDDMDTYTMQFWYCKTMRKAPWVVSDMKKEYTGVYNDILVELFEKYTGLYLSL